MPGRLDFPAESGNLSVVCGGFQPNSDPRPQPSRFALRLAGHLHRLADSFHRPGAFVAQHNRAGSAAIAEINVGMASPAGRHAHQRFVIARTFHFQALDLQWAARRPQYGGSDGDDGRVGHFEFSSLNLKECQLLSIRLGEFAGHSLSAGFTPGFLSQ